MQCIQSTAWVRGVRIPCIQRNTAEYSGVWVRSSVGWNIGVQGRYGRYGEMRGEIREMWGDVPCLGVRDEDVERLRDMGRYGGDTGDVGR